VGKTRIGVLAAQRLYETVDINSILIIVPTQNLRENEWPNEFRKWGCEHLLEYVQVECIQTAYNYDNTYDLVIVDEIHTTLSEQYGKFYERNNYKYILGLTATIPEKKDKQELLDELCPVVYYISLDQAVNDKLVAPYQIFNLGVPLPKGKKWLYNKFSADMTSASKTLYAKIKVPNSKYKGKTPFDLANEHANDKDSPLYDLAKKFWSGMTMRKMVAYNNANKIQTIIDIVKHFPKFKFIIFSKSIKFVEELTDELMKQDIEALAYHSGQKKKRREEVLKVFEKISAGVLVTAEALNAGYDLPDIDAGICASGVSTYLTNIQQLGRILRLRDNKQALYINLYSEDTQEQTWVTNKTQDLEPIWVNKISEIYELYTK